MSDPDRSDWQDGLRDQLHGVLIGAMKPRTSDNVFLRTTIVAIGNAEAAGLASYETSRTAPANGSVRPMWPVGRGRKIRWRSERGGRPGGPQRSCGVDVVVP
jgi:hypothetical protein